MKPFFALVILVGLLCVGMALAAPGYVQPTTQGTAGSGLLYRNGRVALYQNPGAFTGSGVYQARTTKTGPVYNPFPMPNSPASGRDGRYSSHIFLDNQLAYDIYSNPSLLQPRYNTNNIRYLRALSPEQPPRTSSWFGVRADLEAKRYDTLGTRSVGFFGPASRRDKRTLLLDVNRNEQKTYKDQLGYLI